MASSSSYDSWAGPAFYLMRAAAKDQAELIAVSYFQRTDLTYGSDEDMEKVYLQYVSGWMFDSIRGLHPAGEGRLLTENDDLKPGAWSSRRDFLRLLGTPCLGHDPKVVIGPDISPREQHLRNRRRRSRTVHGN